MRTSLTSSHIHKHRVNEPDMLTSASVTRTVLPYRVSKGSTVNSCAIKKTNKLVMETAKLLITSNQKSKIEFNDLLLG